MLGRRSAGPARRPRRLRRCSWPVSKESLAEILAWNERALRYAETVSDDRVRAFYPSLYLSPGRSHEFLGYRAKASCYYRLTAEGSALSGRAYARLVGDGIVAGRKRTVQGTRAALGFKPPSITPRPAHHRVLSDDNR